MYSRRVPNSLPRELCVCVFNISLEKEKQKTSIVLWEYARQTNTII